ncbi:unnamed protein product, partial [Staurois parvus]
SDIGSSGWTAGIGSQGISRPPGHLALDRLARQRASDHRHDRGALGHQALDCLARQRASWSPGMTAALGLTRHQVIWLASGAPRHLARQWAPSHQARQRALSQLARQRSTGSSGTGSSGSTA